MAFSSSNLQIVFSPFTDGAKTFIHRSTDAHATVEGVGYFADGKRLGMAVGDLLINLAHSTAGSSAVTHHIVSASTGAIAASATAGSSAHNQAFNCTVSAGAT